MSEHQGLPVKGYAKTQSDVNVRTVDENKILEEQVLRQIEKIGRMLPDADPRWLSIGKTAIEQGFMAINRAVFKPGRVALPEDQKD